MPQHSVLSSPLHLAYRIRHDVGVFSATRNSEYTGEVIREYDLGSFTVTFYFYQLQAQVHDVLTVSWTAVWQRVGLSIKLNVHF